MLWRLSLFGADVTERAGQLAADIDDLVSSPVYIFNDWHAVMAFGLAGNTERTARVIASNRHLSAPTNAGAAGRAGVTVEVCVHRPKSSPPSFSVLLAQLHPHHAREASTRARV